MDIVVTRRPLEAQCRVGGAAPHGQDEFAHAPLAHPEVPLANGKLLVSISRNTTDWARLKQNPVIGRPIFAEINRP